MENHGGNPRLHGFHARKHLPSIHHQRHSQQMQRRRRRAPRLRPRHRLPPGGAQGATAGRGAVEGEMGLEAWTVCPPTVIILASWIYGEMIGKKYTYRYRYI